MDISKLREPLSIYQIDFRVQSINNGGYAVILAYKDARVDQQVLDNVVGPLGWKREHVHGNHNCIVSVWCDDKKQWVSKEDTGTESNTEAAKGLASDSFKRACFNWGIGRELYDYPLISVQLKPDEFTDNGGKKKGTWKLRPNDWIWQSKFIDGALVYLAAYQGQAKRFEWIGNPNAKDPKQDHDDALRDNLASVNAVKLGIADNDLTTAAEAWQELPEEVQRALWLAPSKGGIFTTEERKTIKEKFSAALRGEA